MGGWGRRCHEAAEGEVELFVDVAEVVGIDVLVLVDHVVEGADEAASGAFVCAEARFGGVEGRASVGDELHHFAEAHGDEGLLAPVEGTLWDCSTSASISGTGNLMRT